MVLGGLNEGTWPGLPDAGPWLNRPMRERLGMQQPERAIGQTAHDFVQAFGPAEVKLVWSRRLEDAPAIPSRWVLRLKMLLKASGAGEGLDNGWQRLARSLAEPLAVTPHGKPRPCPPAAARPRRLSVTRIERLIRDPYAIYARHILDLEPVGAIAVGSDPARRGTIFHNAIGGFLDAYPLNLPGDPLAELLDFGRLQFETYGGDPGILSFWWPRFQRIAAWLVQQEMTDRPRFSRCLAEVAGAMDLVVAGNAFRLTCRADRIDILRTGGARVVDYKTGTVPTKPQVESGLMPQLTLTAAILAAGGFREAGPLAAETLAYVKLGGGNPPGEVKALDFDDPLSDIVQRHTAGLVRLLTAYADPLRPYLPRTAMEKEDDPGDYDHLSRFREWALAGAQR